MTNQYIVYTSIMALQLVIETVYCYDYSNIRGRIDVDLSNYDILNWNNKVGFSHLQGRYYIITLSKGTAGLGGRQSLQASIM